MRQYCRYCCDATLTLEETCYCQVLKKVFTAERAKRINNCKYFSFNPNDLIVVFVKEFTA